MTKIIEKNVAEVIVITIFTIVIMSSCGSVKNTCAAYASAAKENKVLSAHGQENDYYYELMVDKANRENCDKVD